MRHAIEGLNLKALRAFVLVCETKSMGEAARVLGVTTSAISQLIGALEQDQGVPLFDRRFRPARLNAAGATLFEQAESLLTHAQAVSRSVRAALDDEGLPLRIGAPGSVCSALGPDLVTALGQGFHDITFHTGESTDLADRVHGRAIDLAICASPPPESRHLRADRLFSEIFVMAVPRARANGQPFRDLCSVVERFPLLRYGSRVELGAQIERYTAHIGLMAPRRYEFDLSEPLLTMVANGAGCAITTPLCLWQARQCLDELSLIHLPRSRYGLREFVLVSRQDEADQARRACLALPVNDMLSGLASRLRERLPHFPEQPFG
ncbi:LysR family regulatory protein [Bordetella ansorpii]|uniref:LysR family regulatory protein n=1 Tax=Bordetella ansorpii TaxID=288768 RepID=A0A157LXC1_9BORD|nr:LysR family transcriptional regulator [Bordetella ansorpii]SAI01358.1 LysR family regulatory protein [Bordetella ansorpii]